MKLAFVCLLVSIVAMAPRAARAEPARQALGSQRSTPACRAPRTDSATILDLTHTGPVVLFGSASLRLQLGAKRLALALSVSL